MLTQARLLTQHASVSVGVISFLLEFAVTRELACSDRVSTPAMLRGISHCSSFEGSL